MIRKSPDRSPADCQGPGSGPTADGPQPAQAGRPGPRHWPTGAELGGAEPDRPEPGGADRCRALCQERRPRRSRRSVGPTVRHASGPSPTGAEPDRSRGPRADLGPRNAGPTGPSPQPGTPAQGGGNAGPSESRHIGETKGGADAGTPRGNELSGGVIRRPVIGNPPAWKRNGRAFRRRPGTACGTIHAPPYCRRSKPAGPRRLYETGSPQPIGRHGLTAFPSERRDMQTPRTLRKSNAGPARPSWAGGRSRGFDHGAGRCQRIPGRHA